MEGFEGKVKDIEEEMNEIEGQQSDIMFTNQESEPGQPNAEVQEFEFGFEGPEDDAVSVSWNVR